MINFDPTTHRYFVDGVELISVTTLLVKHSLAPDYSGVPEERMKKKADRGTLVHKEIEDYVKKGEIGFTPEFSSFLNYITSNNVEIIDSEKIVYNDIVAGTFDLLIKRDGKLVRVDFKTTSIVHRYECSWQLSCYDDLDTIKADELEVWAFEEDGSMKIVSVPFINKDNINGLFECERKGEIFSVSDGKMLLTPSQFDIVAEATEIIKRAERMKKEAENNIKEVKNALVSAMLDNNVRTFENESLKITLIPAYDKQAIDSAKLKSEMPEVYNKYLKSSRVAATVKISMKGEDNE